MLFENPQAQSGVEKEKLPSVLMVYRDNELFKKIVPLMAQQLVGLGIKADSQVFQVGTSEEEILNWAKENTNKILLNEVLTDETCSKVVCNEYNGGVKPLKKRSGYLDKISDEVICKVLFKDKEINNSDDVEGKCVYETIDLDGEKAADQYEEELECKDNLYVIVLNKIFQNTNNVPEKICIVKEAIFDHGDLQYAGMRSIKKQFKELGMKNDEKEVYDFFCEIVYDENPTPLSKEIFEKSKQAAAERMVSRLEKAGIIKENIDIVDKDYSSFDQENNWIIKDRHFGDNRSAYKPQKAKILELPISSFIEDARKNGMLYFSNEEVEDLFKKVLERDFSSKQKNKNKKS